LDSIGILKMELPLPRRGGVSLRASSFSGFIPDDEASGYSAAEIKVKNHSQTQIEKTYEQQINFYTFGHRLLYFKLRCGGVGIKGYS